MTDQDQPHPGTATETVPATPKRPATPWYQNLKNHDRSQRPGPAPRGSRRSMGKR